MEPKPPRMSPEWCDTRCKMYAARQRDGQRCRKCGRAEDRATDFGRLSVHHVIAIRDGGDHRLSNLVTLCSRCHSEWHVCFADGEPKPLVGFWRWLALPPAYVMARERVGLAVEAA